MRTKFRDWRIPLAFLCVYFFWGSTFVAIRYSVQFLTPGFVSGFRYCIAGLVLLGWSVARGIAVRLDRREFVRQLVVGLLLLTGNNVLLGWGERYVTAGYAALLAASIPIVIALCETFIPGGIPLNRLGWAGTALGLGGLLVLLLPVLRAGLVVRGGLAGSADAALARGTVILLFAVASWIVGMLLAGRVPSRVDALVASAWQMTLAGVANILIGTAVGGWRTAQWQPRLFLALLWLTLFGSLVGYTAYTYLLARVPVAKVATYAYVNPIVAVGLSAAFLHESLRGSQWMAMAIILVAVAIVTASRSKPAVAEKQVIAPADAAEPA